MQSMVDDGYADLQLSLICSDLIRSNNGEWTPGHPAIDANSCWAWINHLIVNTLNELRYKQGVPLVPTIDIYTP